MEEIKKLITEKRKQVASTRMVLAEEWGDITPHQDTQMILGGERYFAKILKEERIRRGLTQAQVAEWASIPASSIAHFENGSRKPSFNTLIKLADALRVSTDFLLGIKS